MDIYARFKISKFSSLLKLRDNDCFHICLYRSLSPQLQIFCHWFLSTWLSTAAQTHLQIWIQILERDSAISFHEQMPPIAPVQHDPCIFGEWSAKQAAGPECFITQFKGWKLFGDEALKVALKKHLWDNAMVLYCLMEGKCFRYSRVSFLPESIARVKKVIERSCPFGLNLVLKGWCKGWLQLCIGYCAVSASSASPYLTH